MRPKNTTPPPCRCNAYPFPHRPGSGACSAPVAYCPDCGSPNLAPIGRRYSPWDELDALCDCGRTVAA